MRAPPTHFFKFIAPPPNSQLVIPKSFTKYLKGNRKKNALLRRGSRKWVVTINDDWSFGEGWEKFAQENGVTEFDFVFFKHQGNMVFETMFFDTSTCERQYPEDHVVNMEAVRTCPQAKSPKKSRHVTRIHEAPIKIKKGKAASIEGTRNASRTGNYPYFKGTVTRSISKYSTVNVPVAFARSNGLDNRNCEMIVRDEKERLWPVKLRKYHDHRVRISTLRDFQIANGLKEGDDFLLELVENGNKPLMNFHNLGNSLIVSQRKVQPGVSNLGSKPVKSHAEAANKAEKTTATPGDERHPYFIGTLKSCSMKPTSVLYLPKAFMRSTGLSNGEMTLRNVENFQESWNVETRDCKGKYVYIARGWKEFQIANGVEEGDHFKFELVENGIKPIAHFSRISKEISKGKAPHSERLPYSSNSRNNPYFKSAVTPNGIKNSIVNIPLEFARSNGLDKRKCEMVVRNEKLHMPDKSHVQVKRLSDFRIVNGLKEGDTFSLELVDNGKKPLMNFRNLANKLFESGGEVEIGGSSVRSKLTESCMKAEQITATKNLNSDRPNFVGTLRKRSISKSNLYLPKAFVMSNGLRKGKMILSMEKQGSWTVKLWCSLQKQHLYIGQGWKEFRVANGLKEGYIFKFELIKNGLTPIANFSRMAS